MNGKKALWRRISTGLFFLLETESNRMINIYYFYDEEILSPNSSQGVRAISIGGESK
jgi:hypothetical protein